MKLSFRVIGLPCQYEPDNRGGADAAELLLRELEVRAACDQLDQDLVEADAPGLGDGGDVRVQVGAHPQVGFAAVGLLGHLHDGTASGTIRSIKKTGRRGCTRPAHGTRRNP